MSGKGRQNGYTLLEAILFFSLLTLFVSVAILSFRYNAFRNRLADTRAGLLTLQTALDAYEFENHQHLGESVPLDEDQFKEALAHYLTRAWPGERIPRRNSSDPEAQRLNLDEKPTLEGGWFYTTTDGKIRVNFDAPLGSLPDWSDWATEHALETDVPSQWGAK